MIKNFFKPSKHKVHFLHIGKTGGSAVKSVLKDFPETDKFEIILHSHDTTVRDIPAGESIIFFLREPVSRFISGFYSRKRKGQPRYYSEWSAEEKKIFDSYTTPNEMALSLQNKDDKAIKGMFYVQHLMRYHYWFGSLEYFKSRVDDILYVGFQESLHDDFRNIIKLLGISDDVALPTNDIDAHRNPPNIDKTIEERGITALKDWYYEDTMFIELCKGIMHEKYKNSEVEIQTEK